MIELVLIDVIYTFNSICVEPIIIFMNVVFYIFIKGDGWIDTEKMLDHLLYRIFSLNLMDVKGYRRLRTISQLLFESLP